MNIKILIGLITVLLFSCSIGKKNYHNYMVGKYNGITQGSLPNTSTNYVLELTDSTFNLKINGHDYNPECNGKWEIKNHILVLLCNEENDLGIILSSGYMNQQKFILNIKDKNTLILNNVVLKRIDNL